MKILGIDTSSKFLSIAVSENDSIIKEESHLLDRRHASELVPKIKALLKKSNISARSIGAFVVGLGPGSFTGMRIGVSAVKGFGLASDKPCIGVASMDSIACNAQEEGRDIVPIIDAKRNQVYAAVYRRRNGIVTRVSDYLLLPVEKLLEKLKGAPIFLGDGVSLYKGDILSLNKKAVFLEEKYWYPGAGNLIMQGYLKIKKAGRYKINSLEPLYLYPEDCQVKYSV